MVIDDLDLVGMVVVPDEADAVLVIDANGMLALSVSTECLQAIVGRNAEIVQGDGCVEYCQLSGCNSAEIGRDAPTLSRPPKALDVEVAEADDHTSY